MFVEMANIFGFCSSKVGAHWWKWHGGGSMRGLGCGGGGLLDIILERGDSKLFKMLSPKF
jgi:hypothetical protein